MGPIATFFRMPIRSLLRNSLSSNLEDLFEGPDPASDPEFQHALSNARDAVQRFARSLKVDVKGFNQFLDDQKINIDAVIKDIVAEATVLIHKGVVERTPVDTGAARNSWMLSVNGYYGEVTNNKEYIMALEEGSSQQAPNGMVAVTLSSFDFEDIANKALRRAGAK